MRALAGKTTVRLVGPLLVLLVPFALLVGLGVNYLSLAEVDRSLFLQERARLLLENQEAALAAKVRETARAALEALVPGGESPEADPAGLAAAVKQERHLRAEAVPGVAGAFLLRGGALVHPEFARLPVLGHPEGEFPFERLRIARSQESWERVNTMVDDCLRTLSFAWALEEIENLKTGPGRRDPDLAAFLDYLKATVLRAQGAREEAGKAFRDLAGTLARNSPRPAREILLCEYEALRMAPEESGWESHLELARSIASGRWNDVPEKFLQFLFHDQLVPALEAGAPPALLALLETEIRPLESFREARRAFGFTMAFLGRALVQAELDKDPTSEEIRFVDLLSGESPLVLAFRSWDGGRADEVVAGAALDLARIAAETLSARGASAGEEEGLEAISVSLRTPRNLPVLGPEPGAPGETESLAVRDLGSPLPGFRLAAVLVNPEEGRRRAGGLRVKLGLYLAALSLMAGAGALFLMRNMRREMELVRLKADFISRVSHDLKTPLALIRLYAETLALGRAGKPEQGERCGRIIAGECDHLTRLVDRVLDFSSLEKGLFAYSPQAIPLAPLVREILQGYAPEAQNRGLDLESDLPDTPPVPCDPEAFRRVLLNLLDNAAKFGGGACQVVLERDAAAIRLEVRDRGAGIPAEERERIFEPFYRGSTAGARRGSGLGLALAKHFAEAHSGSIVALPREGGGSILRLTLPLGNQERPAPAGPRGAR